MIVDEPQKLALQIKDICKSYIKNKLVNDQISLSLNKGEIFGLLGPNGAGKTTLVSQIIGLVKPNSGTIMIDNINIVNNPGYARQVCSFQAQTQVPIDGLTAKQAIELVGRVRGGEHKSVKNRTRELLKNLEMQEWSDKSAAIFSGGMRRLVAFCMAAVVPGEIVVLDEPTNDIDPLRRRLLWQQVHRLSDFGSTVLLVTHNVLEAERIVDRLAIINNGKVVNLGTPASLKENGSENMRLELILEPGACWPDIPDFIKNTINASRRLIGRIKETDIPQSMQWARGLKESGIIEEYYLGPITLEDVYLKAVGHTDFSETTEKEGIHGADAA
jgi:ABC-2 type transport system ATP-binding protein